MSTTAEAVAKRRREQRENIEEAAMELLAHFNHRNLDALLKATRYSLEGLRKRITSSSMVHYLGGKLQTFLWRHLFLEFLISSNFPVR